MEKADDIINIAKPKPCKYSTTTKHKNGYFCCSNNRKFLSEEQSHVKN
jgi:hypothetical protein